MHLISYSLRLPLPCDCGRSTPNGITGKKMILRKAFSKI